MMKKTMWLSLCVCLMGLGCLPTGDGGGSSVVIGGGPSLPGAEKTDSGVEVAPSTNEQSDEEVTQNASSSTGETCSGGSAEECSYWYCRCADGALVNSRFCSNGACKGPGAICEDSCQYFGHGAWTGLAGGGPPPPNPDGSSGNNSNGDPGNTQSCDACIQEDCGWERDACLDEPDCGDYTSCVRDEDAFTCSERYPFGQTPYDDLAFCIESNCSSICGL